MVKTWKAQCLVNSKILAARRFLHIYKRHFSAWLPRFQHVGKKIVNPYGNMQAGTLRDVHLHKLFGVSVVVFQFEKHCCLWWSAGNLCRARQGGTPSNQELTTQVF